MEQVPVLPTADLSDAFPGEVMRVTDAMQNYGGRKRFSGRVRTATTMRDTRLVQQELFNTPGDGDVIVLDGGGAMETALIGDRFADILRQNGWSGIVINGPIRDAVEIAKLDIGVKALGVTPVRSAKEGIGALDVPVAFAGVLFEPGQYLYSDEDGILVSRRPLSL